MFQAPSNESASLLGDANFFSTMQNSSFFESTSLSVAERYVSHHIWSVNQLLSQQSSQQNFAHNSNNNQTAAHGEILPLEAAYVYELLSSGLGNSLLKLRFLFYLVWPTETMFSSLKEVPRYVTEMFPVFFIVALVENLMRLIQGKQPIRVNETVGSLSQGIFQECLRIKVRSIEVLMYCLVWENFRLLELAWDSLWTWWLCYIAVDIGFYWAHRLAHEVNFIWAIHQAHHSSEEFSVVSALRQAVLQPFTAWFTYMPLALFIPPQIFLVHLQLSELYMAWIHTEVIDSIGPLEYILNTPSHHRVHHSRNPEYIDKNYGGMLIIWDRLFNTFKAEDKTNPPVYGLVHPVRSFNPIRVQFHPWPIIWRRIKRAKTIQDKLGVVFYGPGWRPGLPKLGDPTELPKIVRPVNSYDPQISWLKNAYVVLHFGIILMFYHELTLFQHQFSPYILNIGVLSLIASITSLGLILDNKRRYRNVCELLRCILFFQARKSIIPIVDGGLERSGVSLRLRILVISVILLIFALSVLVNSIELLLIYANSLLLRNESAKNKQYSTDKLDLSAGGKIQVGSDKIRVM